jgi:hypothetical protein
LVGRLLLLLLLQLLVVVVVVVVAAVAAAVLKVAIVVVLHGAEGPDWWKPHRKLLLLLLLFHLVGDKLIPDPGRRRQGRVDVEGSGRKEREKMPVKRKMGRIKRVMEQFLGAK